MEADGAAEEGSGAGGKAEEGFEAENDLGMAGGCLSLGRGR